ncbi:MAG: alpha/beta fold hydrolase [Deltaproteobacteria bacterium]|nr:alpha/beta fold hydrolase [Deltaproteobacteria bacterium]
MAAHGLHVETHGAGPSLVLAHGFGGSARNWRPQLRALKDAFAVTVYDARGHARSANVARASQARAEAVVADFAAVADGASAAPLVAGGLSMGAATALRFALAHPERVRALVLMAPPAGPASGRGVSASALAFADAIERDGLEAAGARFAWGPNAGLDAQAAAWVRTGFLEHDAQSLAHLLREYLAQLETPAELANSLALLDVPALVVVGTNDAASLPTARGLAAALPNARLAVVPEAGHVVNLAQPERVNAALREFLASLA